MATTSQFFNNIRYEAHGEGPKINYRLVLGQVFAGLFKPVRNMFKHTETVIDPAQTQPVIRSETVNLPVWQKALWGALAVVLFPITFGFGALFNFFYQRACAKQLGTTPSKLRSFLDSQQNLEEGPQPEKPVRPTRPTVKPKRELNDASASANASHTTPARIETSATAVLNELLSQGTRDENPQFEEVVRPTRPGDMPSREMEADSASTNVPLGLGTTPARIDTSERPNAGSRNRFMEAEIAEVGTTSAIAYAAARLLPFGVTPTPEQQAAARVVAEAQVAIETVEATIRGWPGVSKADKEALGLSIMPLNIVFLERAREVLFASFDNATAGLTERQQQRQQSIENLDEILASVLQENDPNKAILQLAADRLREEQRCHEAALADAVKDPNSTQAVLARLRYSVANSQDSARNHDLHMEHLETLERSPEVETLLSEANTYLLSKHVAGTDMPPILRDMIERARADLNDVEAESRAYLNESSAAAPASTFLPSRNAAAQRADTRSASSAANRASADVSDDGKEQSQSTNAKPVYWAS